MIEHRITIINKLGLHARATAKLVKLASGFESTIEIDKNGQRADAKSIMAVMMLAASKGTDITLHIHGSDEETALLALCDLINDYFGEGE